MFLRVLTLNGKFKLQRKWLGLFWRDIDVIGNYYDYDQISNNAPITVDSFNEAMEYFEKIKNHNKKTKSKEWSVCWTDIT